MCHFQGHSSVLLSTIIMCSALIPNVVNGHATMTRPVARNNRHAVRVSDFDRGGPGCPGEACGWFSEGCASGCKCNGKTNGTVTGHGTYSTPAEMNCSKSLPPSMPADSRARTWNRELKSQKGDWTRFMPWRNPGSATPLDPCGVATDAPGGPFPWLPSPFADWLGHWQDKHHLGGRPFGYRRGFPGSRKNSHHVREVLCSELAGPPQRRHHQSC